MNVVTGSAAKKKAQTVKERNSGGGTKAVSIVNKPRRISVAKVRIPAWFKLPQLAQALTASEQVAESESSRQTLSLIGQTKAMLKTEIGFITNPIFGQASVARTIFAGPLNLIVSTTEAVPAIASRAGSDLPAHLGRMCEAKLLTPEQESMLFRRMNFLRHQAAIERSKLDMANPSMERLALIRQLLAMADWHRDRIVEANTRLVFSIVKKFINANNQFDDLLSDGIVALIRAVEKFDYDRGFRFSTYATQVVRRNAYRQVVEKQQERIKMVGGLQDMNIDVSDEDRGSAISETRWHELRSRLALMLGDLDRREKFIIRARFSLGSHRKVHTLQALADRLGVSKERVRQLERRAMEKLRAMAGEVKLVELEP